MPSWSLHPQLETDAWVIGDLELSRLLLMKDANYPWLVLVPQRDGARDLIDLTETDRIQLTKETDRVARALKDVTNCDKLNVAALGNMVPQLHVHIIARRATDAAWPRPVWGVVPPVAYEAAAADALTRALREKIGLS